MDGTVDAFEGERLPESGTTVDPGEDDEEKANVVFIIEADDGRPVKCGKDSSVPFEGADVPRGPEKEVGTWDRFIAPGKLMLLAEGTSISTLFSKLKRPEANSPNASTSTRKCIP